MGTCTLCPRKPGKYGFSGADFPPSLPGTVPGVRASCRPGCAPVELWEDTGPRGAVPHVHPWVSCFQRPCHGSRATGTGIQHDPSTDRQAASQLHACPGRLRSSRPLQLCAGFVPLCPAPDCERPVQKQRARTASPRPPRESSLPVTAPGFRSLKSDLIIPYDLTSFAAKGLNCFMKRL